MSPPIKAATTRIYHRNPQRHVLSQKEAVIAFYYYFSISMLMVISPSHGGWMAELT